MRMTTLLVRSVTDRRFNDKQGQSRDIVRWAEYPYVISIVDKITGTYDLTLRV